jgi:hypothetical protein
MPSVATRVVLPDEHRGREHATHGRFDHGAQQLHAERGHLADDHVAVAVEHQPRQSVGLAENPAVIWAGRKTLAQRERGLEPLRHQRPVDRMRGMPRNDARRDQRAGIDVGIAEELPAIGEHPREAARLAGRERRGGRIHLVAEHPKMPGAQATIFATLELQIGQNLGVGSGQRGPT